ARSSGSSCSCCLLQVVFEVEERGHDALRVLVDPPVVDLPDRHRVQEVVLLPARAAGDDEPGVLEHPQGLHDAEARHLQLRLELRERAAVALEEPVEQMPAGRGRQCLEHPVTVVHGSRIRDRLVTCQLDSWELLGWRCERSWWREVSWPEEVGTNRKE